MGDAKDQQFFFFYCAWTVNLFHRFLCLDGLDNLLAFALFTLAEFCITGLENLDACVLFSNSPQKRKQECGNKCSYSFSIFETFPEPCCAPAGRMSPDVKDICLFCTFTAILQALHLQPSGHDKVATGEQAKPRAGCQKELFKVNAQVAEKLNILSGVCLSGKNPNQSSLLRKP